LGSGWTQDETPGRDADARRAAGRLSLSHDRTRIGASAIAVVAALLDPVPRGGLGSIHRARMRKLTLLAFIVGSAVARVRTRHCTLADVRSTSSPLRYELKDCTSLDFGYNEVGADGARLLAQALKGNTRLTTLHMGYNNLGDDGARALAAALDGTALTGLYLEHSSIGAKGAAALAEAVQHGDVPLKTLSLGYNQVADGGARALAEMLKSNTMLTSIDLGSNSIGDEGVTALAEALEINHVLTTMNIAYNEIGDDGAHVLADMLERNTVLTTLHYLGTVRIEDELRWRIDGLIDKRPKQRKRARTNKDEM